jgi:hypothetical protein
MCFRKNEQLREAGSKEITRPVAPIFSAANIE